MMTMEEESFLSFCRTHRKIYIYGAGLYGQYYYNILRKLSIPLVGFLTTKKAKETYYDLNVFRAGDIRKTFSKDIGIIGAFAGADDETIRLTTGKDVAVLCPREDVMWYLWHKYLVLPMVQIVHEKYPLAQETLPVIGEWQRILIVRLDVLGDLVMTTALIREVRKNVPCAFIGLVVRKSNRHLFANCPYIDKLYQYEPLANESLADHCRDTESTLAYVEKFIDNVGIKDDRYDICIQPHTVCDARAGIESFMLCCASGAKFQIGRVNALTHATAYFAREMSAYMSHLSIETASHHETEYMLNMLRECGGKVRSDKLELWPSETAQDKIAKELSGISHIREWLAFCFVGSRPQKNWDVRSYAELIKMLLQDHANRGIVMVGDERAASAAKAIGGFLHDFEGQMWDMIGKTTLDELAALLQQCTLYVGADTGVMHMAAAMGTPVVDISIALPGCTAADGAVPERMGPWGVENVALMAPYASDGCYGVCRKTYPHCINLITVEEVYRAVERLSDR